MLKRTNFMVTVLVAGLLNSCATTYRIGKQYSAEHVAKIIIGKTSEKEIIALFGDPWRTGLLNGNIVYTYCYEEIVFHSDDSVDKNGNTLIIEFDENMHVLNYYFNIPGKEPNLLSLIMHKKNKMKQQQEQVAWQNQISTIPNK